MRVKWAADDVPDQRGRVAVITGANAGIGFETAAVLADKGAHVVLAVRDLDKGKQAAARVAARSPRADVSLQHLDLCSLASVRKAADELRATHQRIDLLINNAGVMWTPKSMTADGFELQFGTNHLGHFALTGLLLDHLVEVDGSRVVTVSSPAHRFRAAIHFDDLHWEQRYSRAEAYAQSKLANLMFAFELQRRLVAHGAKTIAVAAHPGGCYSQQVRESPAAARPILRLLFQSPRMGALSPLRAATDPQASGGQYYGPCGPMGVRGHPKPVGCSAQSRDSQLQKRLWSVSEELTGVSYLP